MWSRLAHSGSARRRSLKAFVRIIPPSDTGARDSRSTRVGDAAGRGFASRTNSPETWRFGATRALAEGEVDAQLAISNVVVQRQDKILRRGQASIFKRRRDVPSGTDTPNTKTAQRY